MSATTQRRKRLPVSEMHRRHIAFHEAGHAVVGSALGIRVEYVTIMPTEQFLGHVRWEPGQPILYTYEGITATYAGDKAEELDPTLSLRQHKDGADRASAAKRALELRAASPLVYDNPDKRLELAEARAGEMVREHRWVIAHIATELLTRHRLSGDELRAEIAVGNERSAERARMEREPWFLPDAEPKRGLPLPTTPKRTRARLLPSMPDKSAPWYMPTLADADHANDPDARQAYMESLGLASPTKGAKTPEAAKPARRRGGASTSATRTTYKPDPVDWRWVPPRESKRPNQLTGQPVMLGGHFEALRAFSVTIRGYHYDVSKGENVVAGHDLVSGLKTR